MSKALELNISGIKCDNPKCDFTNKNISVNKYIEWLNRKCPKCGQILLTQEDFDSAMMLISFTEYLNGILPERKEDDKIVSASVEMDGSGKMNFNIKE